jgi:hypothetical protein
LDQPSIVGGKSILPLEGQASVLLYEDSRQSLP